MTMLRVFWGAALELDPAAPDEGRTMRYCTDDEQRAALKEACFRLLGSRRGPFTLSARAWLVRGSVP